MIVGFTGTRDGMTDAQRRVVASLLGVLRPNYVHHGDCVGSDEEFHALIDQCAWEPAVIIHPPINSDKRAYCLGDAVLDPKPYLERNRDIVDVCDVLIATPKEGVEVRRSGTWATIRYARKMGKLVYVVLPDGAAEC